MVKNITLLNKTEIVLDPKKVIMSKTNYKGVIQYANEYFIEISGYKLDELVGKPHNIIRHPDMPKVVFKIMWEKLLKGENLYAVIKNLTKNGDYYWVVTKFETTFDKNGNIVAHYARRKAVPEKIKQTAENIYKTILAIEKHDIKLAEKTFYETLDKYGLTYDDFFLELAEMNEKQVYDYFQKNELNTNTVYNDIVLEIDSKQIKQKEQNRDDTIIDEIKRLKEQVEELKKKILIKEKGFLGDKPELNQAMKTLLNKK